MLGYVSFGCQNIYKVKAILNKTFDPKFLPFSSNFSYSKIFMFSSRKECGLIIIEISWPALFKYHSKRDIYDNRISFNRVPRTFFN